MCQVAYLLIRSLEWHAKQADRPWPSQQDYLSLPLSTFAKPFIRVGHTSNSKKGEVMPPAPGLISLYPDELRHCQDFWYKLLRNHWLI